MGRHDWWGHEGAGTHTEIFGLWPVDGVLLVLMDHDLFLSRPPSGPQSLIKEEFMQDCLQIDLPPHTDPYSQPRPVSVYPSMPLSPPGGTVLQTRRGSCSDGALCHDLSCPPAGSSAMAAAAAAAATGCGRSGGGGAEGPGLLQIAPPQNHGGHASPPHPNPPHTPTSTHQQTSPNTGTCTSSTQSTTVWSASNNAVEVHRNSISCGGRSAVLQ